MVVSRTTNGMPSAQSFPGYLAKVTGGLTARQGGNRVGSLKWFRQINTCSHSAADQSEEQVLGNAVASGARRKGATAKSSASGIYCCGNMIYGEQRVGYTHAEDIMDVEGPVQSDSVMPFA